MYRLMDEPVTSRRQTLFGFAAVTTSAALLVSSHPAAAAIEEEATSGTLQALIAQLEKTPRRRDFNTVPMVLDDPTLWDATALDAVIAYHGSRKQVWDNTELGSPWMNLMRNSLNAQVFSFKHPDFLAVSATHGTAHLALYDQATWEKYQLATLAGPDFKTNTLIVAKKHRWRRDARGSKERLRARRQHHPGAAEARRRLYGLSQRDLGTGQ